MFKLRSAAFSDYSAIAVLHAASWQKAYRGIMSDKFLDNDVEGELLKMWHNRLNAPSANQVVTLAEQNNITLGFSCIYLDDSAAFGTLLDNLHVSVAFQKSGVGKALMKNCAKLILERSNNHKMYLWVFDANLNAKQVYERLRGNNLETIKKKNGDGTEANVCRYVWDNVTSLV